ncbi:PspC domain-containing protein [Enterococcus mediterraneensis]|uniref:PspC domain-containing protein n=1 Tax=Enterococcus mediterraneensis TaxID=2364791 RepID=UPI000F05DE8C|nr:PspC domain-containing protein [Enterococcus mediterraneensis]
MRKKLTKSTDNVVLTGTLGGIAEYLGIDPTIVRVVYVFLSFVLLASPVILYIVLAVIIPSGRPSNRPYGHNNQYYQSNNYKKGTKSRKEAEKIDDDDWSDF